MLQRLLLILITVACAAPATRAADVWVLAGAGICDQMSDFDKDVLYEDDQYIGELDVHHGEVSPRASVGVRLLEVFDLALNYELLAATADEDDDVFGTYDLSGSAWYLTADLVLKGESSLEGFIGVGAGWFTMDGNLEAFGEPYDPEDPAGFEYTPATAEGDAFYFDAHAGVNLDLPGAFFLRPSLEARVLSIPDPEVVIDDSERPAGVDPRPENVPEASDDFELDYAGMVVRLSLGYRF